MTHSGSVRFPIGKLPIATLERLLERKSSPIPGPTITRLSLFARLGCADIAATIIGEVTERRYSIKMLTADGLCDLPLYEQDELTKI